MLCSSVVNRFHSFFFVLHTDGKFMRAAVINGCSDGDQNNNIIVDTTPGAGVLKKVVPKIFGESK